MPKRWQPLQPRILKVQKKSLNYLTSATQDTTLENMTVFDINSLADLVSIAENVVKGEIANRKGNYLESIKYFEAAVAIEDQLNYNETARLVLFRPPFTGRCPFKIRTI